METDRDGKPIIRDGKPIIRAGWRDIGDIGFSSSPGMIFLVFARI